MAAAIRDHRRPIAILVTVALSVAGLVVTARPASAAVSFAHASGSPFSVGLVAGNQVSAVLDYFNADGNLDMAVTTQTNPTNKISIYNGNGSGGFTSAGAAINAASGPTFVTTADMNNDSKRDLVVAYGSGVAVYAGNGNSGFSLIGTGSGGGTSPRMVAVANFNGDGNMDVAIAHADSNNVAVLTGNGAGGFTAVPGSPFAVAGRAFAVAADDVNHDGKTDVVASIYTPAGASVLLGDGTGGFGTSSFYGTGGDGGLGMALGLLNGDSHLDAAVPLEAGGVGVLLGTGSGTFTNGGIKSLGASANGPHHAVIYDFNQDSFNDIAVDSNDNNKAVVLSGDGAGNFTASQFATGGDAAWSIAMGPVNGDSKMDLIVPHRTNNGTGNATVAVLLNTTDTTAPGAPTLQSPFGGTSFSNPRPDFDWDNVTDPSGVTYTLQVDNSGSSFPSPEINVSGLTSSDYSPTSNLADGTYTWRVRATDGAGNVGPFSSTRTFTNDTVPPAAPTLVSPANGSNVSDDTPTFDWSDISDASSYDLLVDNDSDFSSPEIDLATGGLTSSTYTPSSALAGGTYFWEARARDVAGNMGPYSSTRTFTIVGIDQQNLGTDGVASQPGGSYPWGQTFTAGQNNIVSLDVRYCTRGHNPHTFVIRSGNVLTGPNLVTFTASLPTSGNPTAVTHIDIPGGGVALTPGQSYGILVIDGNGAEHLCMTASFGSAYAGGTSVMSGATTDTFTDAYFQTFSSPSFAAPTGVAPDLDATSDSGSSSTDNRTNDTTPTFSGSAPSGSTVRIYADGVQVGSDTAGATDTYSVTTSALSDGGKNITSTIDGGSPSPNLVVFVDTTAPSVPSALDLSAVDSGSSSTDNITNDTTPTIDAVTYWSAEQVTSCTVLVDGVAKASGNSFSGGGVHHFSLTTSALSEGTKSVTATCTDVAGNASAESSALSITIDTTAPGPTALTDPADGSITTDTTPTFDWDDVSGATGYDLQVDNNSNFSSPEINLTNVSDSTHTPASDLADGTYSWRARSLDPAGNASSFTAARTVVVDTAPPAAPILSSPADGALTNDDTPGLDWNDVSDAATYEVLVDNDSDFSSPVANVVGLTSSAFTPSSLSDGMYSWKVRAKDGAGNTGSYSSVRTFTVDTTPPAAPSITGSTPASPANDNAPKLTGSAASGSTVILYTTSDCTGTIAGSGTAAAFNSPGLVVSVPNDTPTTFKATATDAAGNPSACSAGFTYVEDSTAPAAPSGLVTSPASPAQSTTPLVKGSLGSGSPATVEVFTSNNCAGSVAGTGSAADFTTGSGISVTVNSNDGTTPLSAHALDAAGNPSDCSASIDYTLDTVAPDAPTITTTSPASPSNITDPKVKGTIASGAPVTISIFKSSNCSGASFGGTVAAFTGAGITVTVTDNETTPLSAKAADEAGNLSNCSNSIDFTADSIAPAAPTLTSTSPASPANDNAPGVKGTTSTGSPSGILIFKSSDCSGSSAASGAVGTFTGSGITISVSGDAITHLSAKAADAAGNVSTCSNSIDYEEDSTDPAVSVTSGPSGLTNNTTPTFGFTAESGATLACSIDTGTASFGACSGATSHTPGSALSDGAYTFRVRATDAAGNSGIDTRTFTVDATPPSAPSLTAPADGALTNNTTPALDWSDVSGASTYEVLVDNDSDFSSPTVSQTGLGTSAFTPSSALPEGTYSWKARAKDAAGNAGGYSTVRTFTVDTTPPSAPTVSSTDPASGANDNAPKVIGTAAAGSTVKIFASSTCSGSPEAMGPAATFASPGIAVEVNNDSTTTFKATATDAAGNPSGCSSTSVTYSEDSTAPATPSVTDSDPGSGSADLTPEIKGTAEAGSTVKLFTTSGCTGGPAAQGSAASFATPGLTVTVTADSPTTFRATATDAAGNISGCSSGFTYVNDTGPANFLVNDPSVKEGDSGTGTTNLTFSVELSKPRPSTSSVKVNTADGTALAGSDYTAVPLTKVTFAPNEIQKFVIVPIIGDVNDEPDETVFLKLSSPVGANMPDTKGVGTIVNDPDPVPALSVSDVTKAEADTVVTFSFKVTLSEASGRDVTFTAETADGTAKTPKDYEALPPMQFTIPAGTTSGSVKVKISVKGDNKPESTETFFVRISAPTNATIADSEGLGTITDND